MVNKTKPVEKFLSVASDAISLLLFGMVGALPIAKVVAMT
jgi:hypothetical protein